MNKIKSLAVAVTLAVAAGSVHAKIATGQSGNGELFLSVWDQVGAKSYVRDLGITMNDFGTLNAPTQTAAAPGSFVNYVDSNAGSSKSWATDTTWATFTAGKTAAEINSFVWDVYAMDGVGTTAAHTKRYLTTTNADVLAFATTPLTQQSNGQLDSFSITNGYLNAINSDPDGQSVSLGDDTANGSGIFLSGSFAYMGDAAKAASWGGKAAFSTAANVGTSLDFYYGTRSGGTSTQEALFYKYGNASGDATFLLANDGSLAYQVAAVPEAETWAMFGAGLLMVGAIARRRMAS